MTVDVQRLVVVVLALIGLLLEGGSVPHQHLDAHTGLFDHNHDITALAAGCGGLVPDGPDAAPVLIALALAVTPPAAVRVQTPRHDADPRAPPQA